MHDTIWAWADPTAYVSAQQAREARKVFNELRRNEPVEFSRIVERYREEGY